MADKDEAQTKRPKPTKKKGLPPISPRANADENDETDKIKPVKRKPRKKASASGANEQPSSPTSDPGNGEVKPVAVRRRKRSPSQNQGGGGGGEGAPAGDTTTTTPRKKKRRPKQTTAEEPDPSQNAESSQPTTDPQGSKTSLISKDGETPRKKAGGKKKKKVKKASAEAVDEDDYGESPWAEDLRTMHDDIITGSQDGEEDGEEGEARGAGTKKVTNMFVAAPILKSQPLEKIFIETSSKFKGQNKSALNEQRLEEAVTTVMPQEVSRMTTSDFALGTNRVFRVVSLFLHGLVAGLALWQTVTVWTLGSFTADDFLEHYYDTAMPLQGCFYFLLVMCTVSVCDRFDIGNPTRRFVLRAVTLQNGAVSILFCLVALVLNTVAIRYEDRMSLYRDYVDLYSGDNVSQAVSGFTTPPNFMKEEEIATFQSVNTARCVFIVLSWFVLSVTPNSDRLGKSLRSGRTGLEREVEMDRVSSA
ncbi:transmembrane protein 237 [Aplysia californica]|uniref:Transmembrane protein 237 n=1 Tax=Aplysia californica TaxID=6500 RepID=A0ABM1A8Y6_APLCA|nr:transmembrane protein 237 [Aplysia californica]